MYMTTGFNVKMKKKEKYEKGELISIGQKLKIEYGDNLIYKGKSTIDFPQYYYKEIIKQMKRFRGEQHVLQEIIGFPMKYEGDTIPVVCVIIDSEESLIGIAKYYTLSHKNDDIWDWEVYELIESKPRKTLHLSENFELKELPIERSIFYKAKDIIEI